MTTVLFVCRHGERLDYIDPLWPSTSSEPWDSPLSQMGRAQILLSAQRVMDRGITSIVTSPLRRTVESAQVASQQLQMAFDVDDGLVEWQNPLWFPHRIVGNPVWLLQATQWSGRRRCTAPVRFPETEDQAKARCAAVARRLFAVEKTVLVITHECGACGIASSLTGKNVSQISPGEMLEFSL